MHPLFNALSIQKLPSSFSVKSLHNNNPNPEPFSFAVPVVVLLTSILKLFCYQTKKCPSSKISITF